MVHCKSHTYFRFPRIVNPSTWTVPDICAAYEWPTGLKGGGTIGIVELGGGWVQSDIDAYFQSIDQPSPSLTDVSVDGTKNSPGNDNDMEVALDIEVAGAAYFVATGKPATIRVYWSQDIASAVAKASKDGCAVCSISWGADEAAWGSEACKQMDAAAKAATDAGIAQRHARTWWDAAARRRQQAARRFGITTPAKRTALELAADIPPFSRLRLGR